MRFDSLTTRLIAALILASAWVQAQDGPARAERVGEDLGQKQNAQAGLARQIQKHMEDAHRRLLRRDSSKQTQEIQLRILRELEGLLAQGATASKASTASKSPTGGAGANTATPFGAESAKVAPRNTLKSKGLRGMWGHFPPKTQQQLRGIRVDQFVPRYSSQIQEFYKKLANRLVDPP